MSTGMFYFVSFSPFRAPWGRLFPGPLIRPPETIVISLEDWFLVDFQLKLKNG